MHYLRNHKNRYLTWRGKDKEDGYRIKYSYRVDKKEWSEPSHKRGLSIRYLKRRLRIRPGKHIFEIKAIDTQGLESKAKSAKFNIKIDKIIKKTYNEYIWGSDSQRYIEKRKIKRKLDHKIQND